MKTTTQQDSFFNEGFEYKGIRYRPISAGSMIQLEIAKSCFLTDNIGVRGIMDFLYVHGEDKEIVRTIIRRRDPGIFEDAVIDFAEQFSTNDLQELSKMIEEQANRVSENQVEPKKKPA